MTIQIIDSSCDSAWEQFVEQNNCARIFHTLGWKNLIERNFPFKNRYIAAFENDRITGILPLFQANTLLGGRQLISVPFAPYAGICSDNSDTAAAIAEYAKELAAREKSGLEIRHGRNVEKILAPWDHYYTFHLDLSNDMDTIGKNLRKSTRRAIKKTLDSDLKMHINKENIQSFFKFYAKDQKKQGTPVQRYNWFKGLFDCFPESHFIASTEFQGKTIAMFLMRRYKNIFSAVIGNDLSEYRYLNANLFMEWKMIEYAHQQNCKIYDFGRSIKESGTYFFKLGWGAQAVPIPYYRYHPSEKSFQDTSQSSGSRKYIAFAWKRLPLKVTTAVGPLIRKQFP